MEKAGFFKRFIAWLIDGVILAVVAVILANLFVSLFDLAGNTTSGFWNIVGGIAAMVSFFALLVLQFVYFGYFWAKDGRSLGMRLMGVKVVTDEGGTPSFLRAGFRGTVGYWISGIVFGLGYLWALFDAHGETWHDKIFHTRVVKA